MALHRIIASAIYGLKAYDSVMKEVLYNIRIEFGISRKLVRLTEMCLSETYSRVHVDKHLSEMFPLKNGLVERSVFFTIAFQLHFGVCHKEGSGNPGWLEIKWFT
jgi:hypothetical protein